MKNVISFIVKMKIVIIFAYTNVNTNAMPNVAKNKTIAIPPKKGWIKKLADEMKCSRHTVTKAIYHGTESELADSIREVYASRYGKKPLF